MSIDLHRVIVITGGAGFVGTRVAARLLERYPRARIRLTDVAETPRLDPLKGNVQFLEGDLADAGFVMTLIGPDVGCVFHFASLVSGGAERDFGAGLQANVFGTINVLEACRTRADKPVLVFTSSIATFGGKDLPEKVDDHTFQHPQNSYGVAKVVGEQLLNDYSRKGFLSGRGVRLPAIVVRDVANTAASGYASSMIREPLAGKDYTCPVSPNTRIPIMGVGRAVDLLVGLSELDGCDLGDYRTINGRGVSPSASEIADAVRRLAPDPESVGPITFKPDTHVDSILSAWPRMMSATRSDQLGLPGEGHVDDIVTDYLHSLRQRREGPR